MSSGGDGILTITGFGRFEKLHAEYNKLLTANDKLAKKLKAVEDQSEKIDQAQDSAIDKLTTKAIKMVSAYQAAHMAISLANAAIQKQIDLERQATNVTINLADAQKNFANAMGIQATADQRRGGINRFSKVGVDLGFGESGGLQVATQVYNSVVEADPIKRAATVESIMREALPYYSPAKMDEAARGAAAVGDLMKGLPGVSPREIVQMQMGFLGTARIMGVEDLPNIQQGVVSAQVSAPDLRGSAAVENTRQAFAMMAAIGGRLGDDTGELTRTAFSGLSGVFREKAGKNYRDLPLYDAIRKAAAEKPSIIRETEKDLLGRVFTKDPQREILQGTTTSLLTEVALGEMARPSEKEWSDFARFALKGTPEMATAGSIRRAGASQEAANRKANNVNGAIRAILFGGEFGEQEYPGAMYAGQKGFANTAQSLIKRAMFEAAIIGSDSFDVAMNMLPLLNSAIAELRANPGRLQSKALRERYEAMIARRAQLQTAQWELSELRRAIEDNSTMISNGQNAQAAAAQRNAQVE